MTDSAARTSHDAFLGGRLRISQPVAGYRAGLDAVLLAAAAEPRRDGFVVELGCGVGAVLCCLAKRRPDLRALGVEIDREAAHFARRNVRTNGLEDRIGIVGAAVEAPCWRSEHAQGRVDMVLANPPFHAQGRHDAPEDAAARRAGHDPEGLLAAWIGVAAALLGHKGRLALIHRADRMDDLLRLLTDHRFGKVRLLPLWPKPGRPAKRLLIEATRFGRAPPLLLPGHILHTPDGAFTHAIQAVLRHGQALPWLAPVPNARAAPIS